MKRLLQELQTLRIEGPKVKEHGICAQVTDDSALVKLAKLWPKYSGSAAFPVPGYQGLNPGDAYMASGKDKWNRATQYGRDRWELVDFLITALGGAAHFQGSAYQDIDKWSWL